MRLAVALPKKVNDKFDVPLSGLSKNTVLGSMDFFPGE